MVQGKMAHDLTQQYQAKVQTILNSIIRRHLHRRSSAWPNHFNHIFNFSLFRWFNILYNCFLFYYLLGETSKNIKYVINNTGVAFHIPHPLLPIILCRFVDNILILQKEVRSIYIFSGYWELCLYLKTLSTFYII